MPQLVWLRRYKYEIVIIPLVIIADRLTKQWVLAYLPRGELHSLLPGFVSLFFTTNTGAAFSMLAEHTGILALLSSAVLLFMIYSYREVCATSLLGRFGWILVFAGAVGNLWDRLTAGFVVDFLSFDFITFPVFNVADMAITCGALLFAAGILREHHLPKEVGDGSRE